MSEQEEKKPTTLKELNQAALQEVERMVNSGDLTMEDMPPEFFKALQEGRIVTMTADSEEDMLVDDGTGTRIYMFKDMKTQQDDYYLSVKGKGAQAYLVRDSNAGPETVCLSVVDGGGFTGVIMTFDQWETMKTKIDTYVRECRGKDA